MSKPKQSFESVWELTKSTLMQQKQELGSKFGRTSIQKHVLENYNIVVGTSIGKRLVSALKDAPQNFLTNSPSGHETFETDDKGNLKFDISAPWSATEVVTLEDFAKTYKVDLDKYEVTKFKHGAWGSGENRLQTTNAEFKPSKTKSLFLELKKDLSEQAKLQAPIIKKRNYSKHDSKCLVVTIFDLHIMKYAIKGIGGDEYNSHIAVKLFIESINYLISKYEKENLEQIILPLGNDFYNIDNLSHTTQAGTAQHSDVSPIEGYIMGKNAVIEAIETLEQIAPVVCPVVPGNHDYHSSILLGENIADRFHRNKNVTVIGGEDHHKILDYGTCVFGFSHGDKTNDKKVPTVFQELASSLGLWDGKKSRTYFSGHKHTAEHTTTNLLNEDVGIRHFKIPSLSSPESWHRKYGYVGNVRASQAFLFSKKWGLEDMSEANSRRLLDIE